MTKHIGLSVALITLLCGCDRVQVERVPIAQTSDKEPSLSSGDPPPEAVQADEDQFGVTTWLKEEELPYEAHYIQYMDGKRVGCFTNLASQGENLIRVQQTGSYAIPVQGDVERYTTELESLEFPSGKMISFREVTRSEEKGTVESEGEVETDRVIIRVSAGEGPDRIKTEWKESYWGVLGIQSVTKARPLQPGERRKCTVFVPRLNRALRIELVAGEPELSALPGGKTPMLIPVEVAIEDGDKVSRSKSWVDENGEIMKTISTDQSTISTFRAPKWMAERMRAELAVEGKLSRTCKFYGIPPSQDDDMAVYMIESSNFDMYSSFDRKVRQRVKSISALSLQVAVLDVWDTAVRELDQDPPQPEDRESGEWLSLDRPRVVALSKKTREQAEEQIVLQGNSDSASEGSMTAEERLPIEISRSLASSVKDVPLSAHVTGADESARKMEGDENAKAVLLIAVLRNNEIPARLALGMRVDAVGKVLRYYPWVEAWVNERWLPLNATEGGVMGLDCIKLQDVSLAEHPYGAILATYETMEQVTVRRVKEEQ